MIKIIDNSDLIDDLFDYDVILFSMGINNSINKGFPYELALNFPIIREEENKSPYCDNRKLGKINITHSNNIDFCACYIHNGGYQKGLNSIFTDYNNIEGCINLINKKYKDKKIATYIIGASNYDGNGDKSKIIELLSRLSKKNNLYIYTKEQDNYQLKMFKEIAKLREDFKNNIIDSSEYSKRRSEIEWLRRYGKYNKMPENYTYKPKKSKIKYKFIGKIKK